MLGFVKVLSENFKLKQLKKNQKEYFYNLFTKKDSIEKADTLTIDTGLSIKLPENVNAFLATKLKVKKFKKLLVHQTVKRRCG